MGSRIRERPKNLFEVFVEIAKPQGEEEAPFIIQKFPFDFEDKEALTMIPKFAYPCEINASKVDHFTFVLTDLDSMFRFGYCRHATGHQTCLCIVSWLPWCEVFFKLLDLLAEITNRTDSNQVTEFLQATYNHDVPSPRLPVTIVANEDMFSFTTPDPNILPSIPSSRNLTEYYNAVDPSNMMHIFASMLHERRIYMTSKKLSRLTACIHAAEALLYPMHWQHLYIPVLPAHLIDYISAPMPYLIGVHTNLLKKLQENRVDVGDAVVVDLDSNTFTSEYDDLGDLPEDVSSFLKRNLKTDVVKSSMVKAGDAISMAFLHALVRLIGGYRDALKFRPGEPITFDPEAFVQSRPSPATQEFLEGMLSLQIFQQFIYGRLEILNSGDGFQDIFEQQATIYTDKLNSQSRYKEWLKSVKKSGKTQWRGFKVKVKEQGKKAVADIKTKFSGTEEKKIQSFQPTGGTIHKKSTKTRPATTHEATLRSNRPPRPPPPTKSLSRPESMRRTLSIEDSADDSQLRLSYHTVDVNLMADTDIQAALQRSASAGSMAKPEEIDEIDSSVSSTSSSGSLDDVDNPQIPFGNLQSSDESLSSDIRNTHFVPETNNTQLQQQQDNRMTDTGDKLILTRAKPPPSPGTVQPIPPPRGKRSNLASPNPSPHASPGMTVRNTGDTSRPLKPSSNQSGDKGGGTVGEGQGTKPSQETPLIDFDSPESETKSPDGFDPLSPSVKSGQIPGDKNFEPANQGTGQDHMDDDIHGALQRNQGSRVSLTRTKAFRRENSCGPLRPGYKDNTQDDCGKHTNATDLFDPLSNPTSDTSKVSAVSTTSFPTHSVRADPLASHSPRRESSDLMKHEWSLAFLAKSPNITMPVGNHQPATRFSYSGNLMGDSHTKGQPCVHQSLPATSFQPTAFSHQGQMLKTQGQPQVFQGHHASNFHGQSPSTQPMPRTPGKLSSTSLAPYSRPQSSITPINRHIPPPIPSSSTPFLHSNFKQTPRVMVPGANNNTIQPADTKQQLDPFNDLLNIDFGNGGHTDSSQQQRLQEKVSPARPPQPATARPPQPATVRPPQPATVRPPQPVSIRPPQPKWETFD